MLYLLLYVVWRGKDNLLGDRMGSYTCYASSNDLCSAVLQCHLDGDEHDNDTALALCDTNLNDVILRCVAVGCVGPVVKQPCTCRGRYSGEVTT